MPPPLLPLLLLLLLLPGWRSPAVLQRRIWR
jgi:hypothetical protein